MGNKLTVTDIRHQKIYKCYLQVIKSHGIEAREMSKESLYAEVADLWGMNVGSVKNIILAQMKLNPKFLDLVETPFKI